MVVCVCVFRVCVCGREGVQGRCRIKGEEAGFYLSRVYRVSQSPATGLWYALGKRGWYRKVG